MDVVAKKTEHIPRNSHIYLTNCLIFCCSLCSHHCKWNFIVRFRVWNEKFPQKYLFRVVNNMRINKRLLFLTNKITTKFDTYTPNAFICTSMIATNEKFFFWPCIQLARNWDIEWAIQFIVSSLKIINKNQPIKQTVQIRK